MGTIKEPRLTEIEVVRMYNEGMGRTMIALRARKPDYWVREILLRHNVELRPPTDVQKINAVERIERHRLRRRERRPMYRGVVEGDAAD